MSTPNPTSAPNVQLEAALVQFANQPGVSADQAGQLRAAVMADATQLQLLNQHAQAGNLHGFALPQAGSTTPNLIGSYDMASGVVTLPLSAFQPSGTAASADLTATVKVQQMSVAFSHSTWPENTAPAGAAPAIVQRPVTQDMVDNLQRTFNESPVLAADIRRAVSTVDTGDNQTPQRAHLERFGFVPPGQAAGGTYNGGDKAMNLPAFGLQTNSPTNPQGRYDARDMTFVLGHEIQHGFNHPNKHQATQTYLQDVENVAKSSQAIHDYTPAMRAYIQAGREDEARAEIAGWNALLSREQQTNPNATIDDMRQIPNSRLQDFVRLDNSTNPPQTVPLPGLTFNPDGSLTQTAGNIAAMGQHYFNRPAHAYAVTGDRPVGLGENSNPLLRTDYTNYYGTWAVETAIAYERAYQPVHAANGLHPQMAINMGSIGLRQNLMELNGIDLGSNTNPQPYLDTGTTPPTPGNFDHTQNGPNDHQHVSPVGPPSPANTRSPNPRDPNDPDHQRYLNVRAGVERAETSMGKGWDENSERLVASLTLLAKQKGFGENDKLEVGFSTRTPTSIPQPGELVFLNRIGGNASPDPRANWGQMDTMQAIARPVDAVYRDLETYNQAQEQEQARSQAQHPNQTANEPDDPLRGGPTMR